MSPTDAILILNVLLSGSGGRADARVVAVSGFAVSTASIEVGALPGGAVVQPASAASTRNAKVREELITEPDAKHVDLSRSQAAAEHVEFVEVVGWAYTHTVICLVINSHTLDL